MKLILGTDGPRPSNGPVWELGHKCKGLYGFLRETFLSGALQASLSALPWERSR